MSTDWIDADATVASSIEHGADERPIYEVVFTYKVNDGWYGGTFTTFIPYREGDKLAVRYDSRNPARNNYVQNEKRQKWDLIVFFSALGLLTLWLVLRSTMH